MINISDIIGERAMISIPHGHITGIVAKTLFGYTVVTEDKAGYLSCRDFNEKDIDRITSLRTLYVIDLLDQDGDEILISAMLKTRAIEL